MADFSNIKDTYRWEKTLEIWGIILKGIMLGPPSVSRTVVWMWVCYSCMCLNILEMLSQKVNRDIVQS